MLGRRRRRRANIEATLVQCLVFVGDDERGRGDRAWWCFRSVAQQGVLGMSRGFTIIITTLPPCYKVLHRPH